MILRSLVLTLALISAVVGGAWAQDLYMQQKPAAPLSFHVTGQAEAMPDVALLHFSIVGDGESLGAAQEQLDQTEQAVAKALGNFGIKRSQMKVESFNITPLQPSLDSSPMNPTTLPALGYRAQRDYTVPASDVKSIHKLIQIADAALQQGARPTSALPESWRGGGYGDRQPGMLLEFTVKDSDKLLKAAVNDALARARRLAEVANKQMGNRPLHLVYVTVTESSSLSRFGYPTPGGDDQPATSSALRPVKMAVSADIGFSNK